MNIKPISNHYGPYCLVSRDDGAPEEINEELKRINRLTDYKNSLLQLANERPAKEPCKSVTGNDEEQLVQGSSLELNRAFLAGADLSEIDLSGVDLSYADLTFTNLYKTNLSDANLTAAYLSYARLSRTNLTNAVLLHADLVNTNLLWTNLHGADLYDAELEGAFFFEPQGLSERGIRQLEEASESDRAFGL
ncbi:MAG: pentapeptide repeat-containing protein [Candidatus Caenarcaniphilales bacterium]|nr:pentapeptide repeat-containing protein [Candidatus Caenarcaniphilales bacterium]